MQKCFVHYQALCVFNELLRHHKIHVCTQKCLCLAWPSLIQDTEVILKSKALNVSQRFANNGWKEDNALASKERLSKGTSELEIRAQ